MNTSNLFKTIGLAFIILASLFSCREDFLTNEPYSQLTFSKDTVFLDTVFSTIGSHTYQLKVYNKSSQNIVIPSITLGKGDQSFYRLNVDGIPGKSFSEVPILAKDSLYVFIETNIDYQQVTDPLYIDSIIFSGGNTEEFVQLVTLVKDAYFMFPSKNAEGVKETIPLGVSSSGEVIEITGFYLEPNTVLTDEKPYVIYGYGAVPKNGSLTIEAGAVLHFHQNSGLIVEDKAKLIIEGSLHQKVVMEGDRLEHNFSELPGQWGGIWLRAGSYASHIDHALIKNATIGVLVDSIGSLTEPTLTISNTEIYNSANFGLWARTARINGHNLVINNSGQSSLALTMGGSYDFKHSSIANFWYRGYREYPALLINNYYTYTKDNIEYVVPRALNKANFTNCLIDGSNYSEFLLDRNEGAPFQFYFANNGIKFNDSQGNAGNERYNFDNISYYAANLINPQNDFKSPETNQLIIGELSDAIGKASVVGTQAAPIDLRGVNRSIPGDLGAYEHIVFER